MALLWGAALLRLVGARRARPWYEYAASALLAGLALQGAVGSLLVQFAGAPERVGAALFWAVLLLPAAGGLAAVLRRRQDATQVLPAEPWRLSQRLLALLLLLASAWVVFYTASMPVHVFDPVFHFAYKGRLLYEEGLGSAGWTDLDGPVGRVMTHPNYPPGLPALQMWVAVLRGAFSEDAARVLQAAFALAPAAWLCAWLGSRSRSAGLLLAGVWLSLPILYYTRVPSADLWPAAYGLLLGRDAFLAAFPGQTWTQPDGWLLDGAGDLALAAFVLGTAGHLWRFLDSAQAERDHADAWIAGLCAAGALLAKNEGLPLVGLCLGLALLAQLLGRASGSRRQLGPRLTPALLLAAGLALLLCAAWFWLRRSLPRVDEDYDRRASLETLRASLPNIGLVGGEYLRVFRDCLLWSLVWPLFFLSVLLLATQRARALNSAALYPALLVVSALALYFLVLLITPWDLPTLFQSVIPGRLFLHVTPLACLVIGLLAWPSKRERGA